MATDNCPLELEILAQIGPYGGKMLIHYSGHLMIVRLASRQLTFVPLLFMGQTSLSAAQISSVSPCAFCSALFRWSLWSWLFISQRWWNASAQSCQFICVKYFSYFFILLFLPSNRLRNSLVIHFALSSLALMN